MARNYGHRIHHGGSTGKPVAQNVPHPLMVMTVTPQGASVVRASQVLDHAGHDTGHVAPHQRSGRQAQVRKAGKP